MDHYLQHLLREWHVSPTDELAHKIANAAARTQVPEPPAYLAVGFRYDEGHTFSRWITHADPRQVYQYLCSEAGYSYEDDEGFDQILLFANGEVCPDVIEHWSWKDWQRYP